MLKIIKYKSERVYPYILAIVAVVVLWKSQKLILKTESLVEVLNGLVTLDSIVIGFLGAIMPVILSMKNESKFVRYVFENDKKGLFGKYLRVTIFSGIVSAMLSLILHLRENMNAKVQTVFYCAWIFFTVVFLSATYRSMSHMITLVFSKDNDIAGQNENEKGRQKTEDEKRLEDLYSDNK